MVSEVVPVLVRVTLLLLLVVPVGWLEKARLTGEKLTVLVTVPVPVPVRATICGLPDAPSFTVSAPEIGPLTVGENVTLIVQVLLAAIVPVQVLVGIA